MVIFIFFTDLTFSEYEVKTTSKKTSNRLIMVSDFILLVVVLNKKDHFENLGVDRVNNGKLTALNSGCILSQIVKSHTRFNAI